MYKKLGPFVILFCFSHSLLYAEDFGNKIYNWLYYGIKIPFIGYTRDVSVSDSTRNGFFCYREKSPYMNEANNCIYTFGSTAFCYDRQKEESIKSRRIFPCIKQVKGTCVKREGQVMSMGLSRNRAGVTMTYNFMPADFLLLSALGCGVYWLYKNLSEKSSG